MMCQLYLDDPPGAIILIDERKIGPLADLTVVDHSLAEWHGQPVREQRSGTVHNQRLEIPLIPRPTGNAFKEGVANEDASHYSATLVSSHSTSRTPVRPS